MSAPTSLFTCRYWAFGPGCPNISHGKNVCLFAHWDTGRLASEFDQRGTCRFWLQGSCTKGPTCFYEHRKTGVDGLYQGRVKLNGLNLDIATAAGKSGFNTHNHSALFDLIWAVKRVALRASKGAALDRPPPRNPVYPDRFRPSGVGDNTKRKRPAPHFVPPEAPPLKLESVIKEAPIKRTFRYRNKKAPARSKQNAGPKLTGYITSGTQENPVDLLSDNNDAEPAGAKRQKLNVANTSQAPAAPERNPAADTETLFPRPDSVSQDTMQVDGHTYIRTNAQYNDGPQDDHGPNERQLQSLRIDLNRVKDALESVESNVEWCNDSMSKAFENYRDMMARRDIHSSLTRLGGNFETAKLSSLEGVGNLIDILEKVRKENAQLGDDNLLSWEG